MPGVMWDTDIVLTFRFVGNCRIMPCSRSVAGKKEVNILEVAASV